MKKSCLLGILMIIAMSSVWSVTFSPDIDQETKDSVEDYNSQMSAAPGVVRSLIGNGLMKMIITDDTDRVYAAVTNKSIITVFDTWNDTDNDTNHDPWQAEGKKADKELKISLSKLEEISKSNDSAKAFQEAWGEEIDYKGLTFWNKIKGFFLDIGVGLVGIFT